MAYPINLYPTTTSWSMIHLLDIEGTVCSITFVKDVLYPYFLENYSEFVGSTPFPVDPLADELSSILAGFPAEVTQSAETLTQHILYLVSNDIKDPVLKAFQGIVWEKGYMKGDLKAPIYRDAIEFLNSGKRLYIYSSGSVYAQKLLFLHVDVDGKLEDLTGRLSGYFDITTSGYKQQKTSYENIIASIGCSASDITFYSDNVSEVKAALEAGMAAKVVVRPGNAPISSEDQEKLDIIYSF